MRIVKRSIPINEALFFAAYIIFLFFTILSQSFYFIYFNSIYRYIVAGCCALLVLQEVVRTRMTRNSLWGLILAVFLFALTFYGSKTTTQSTVPAIFLFVFIARDIDCRRIARLTLHITSALMVFIIFSAYAGIIQDYVSERESSMGYLRVRHYLGFRYALYPSAFFKNIIALKVYLEQRRIKNSTLLLYLAISYWIYVMTDSRLSFYLGVIILVFAFVVKYLPRILKQDWLFAGGVIAFPLFFTVVLLLTVFYDPSSRWMSSLNTFLSTRLSLGQESLILNGVSLLPQRISWVGHGLDMYGRHSADAYSYVDSFYIQVFQHYGVIFMVLLLAALFYVSLRLYREREFYVLFLFSMVAVHCVIDDLQIYLCYNTFWIIAVNTLMPSIRSGRDAKKTGSARRRPRRRIVLSR